MNWSSFPLRQRSTDRVKKQAFVKSAATMAPVRSLHHYLCILISPACLTDVSMCFVGNRPKAAFLFVRCFVRTVESYAIPVFIGMAPAMGRCEPNFRDNFFRIVGTRAMIGVSSKGRPNAG
jgi:hypothetical protein